MFPYLLPALQYVFSLGIYVVFGENNHHSFNIVKDTFSMLSTIFLLKIYLYCVLRRISKESGICIFRRSCQVPTKPNPMNPTSENSDGCELASQTKRKKWLWKPQRALTSLLVVIVLRHWFIIDHSVYVPFILTQVIKVTRKLNQNYMNPVFIFKF